MKLIWSGLSALCMILFLVSNSLYLELIYIVSCLVFLVLWLIAEIKDGDVISQIAQNEYSVRIRVTNKTEFMEKLKKEYKEKVEELLTLSQLIGYEPYFYIEKEKDVSLLLVLDKNSRRVIRIYFGERKTTLSFVVGNIESEIYELEDFARDIDRIIEVL